MALSAINELGVEETIRSTARAVHTTVTRTVGGERNTGSIINNYDAVKHECNRTILSAGITAKSIAVGNPAIYLMGVHVHAALSGTLTVAGLFAEDGTTAASYVLPVGFVGHYGFANAVRFEVAGGGCIMTKSSALDDGKISVDWRNIA